MCSNISTRQLEQASVANAKRFGKEIGQELKDANVEGVIMTST